MADSSSSSRASDRRKAVQEAIRKLTTRAEAAPNASGQHDVAPPKTKQHNGKAEAGKPAEGRIMRQGLQRAAPATGAAPSPHGTEEI